MAGRLAIALAATVLGFGFSVTVDGAVPFAPVVSGGEWGAAPTCKPVTANYITHCLPQQCLRTPRASQTAAGKSSTENTEPSSMSVTATAAAISHKGLSFGRPNVSTEQSHTTLEAIAIITTHEAPPESSTTSLTTAESAPTAELPKEDDSPLDTANFLSFEEWKAQNLACAGQSSDTFEPRHREPRKDPQANPNALDALGEDSEIEFDFGFDSGNDGAPEYRVGRSDKVATPAPADPGPRLRGKDAGKTCRERFNYASFDCAATVHKTNPGCKGATSILVENKDSYMRNKCGQENKHFIVELCEDILVDTVVLANFEFFSSMFRTFRVSVSDRYPVKANGWKDLGTFEARNSRQVQAFLIENPLIWARYLKVELLTHYGNEFYCPVSLLRVHGTTMMEEFRHQEELARGEIEDDVREDLAPEAVAAEIKEEEAQPHTPKKQSPTECHPEKTAELAEATPKVYKPDRAENQVLHNIISIKLDVCKPRANQDIFVFNPSHLMVCGVVYTTPTTMRTVKSYSKPATTLSTNSIPPSPSSAKVISQALPPVTQESVVIAAAQDSSQREATPTTANPSTASKPVESHSHEPKQQHQQHVPHTPPSHAHPPSASPTTQESFFKTVHKRLSLLEQNATLSLQYIEDQSRILRDAFVKVEKRQMEKTMAFIEQLNATFLTELKVYKDKYDQLWQSTVIALESQREQSERDMAAVSTRLTILADEMIFQKRMYQIQSFLLLVTIGVVIFSRNSQLDTPLLQHMRTRSTNLRMLDTPPSSPLPRRRRSEDSSVGGPAFELSPPPEEYTAREGSGGPLYVRSEGRTQSSPVTPNGTRTRRSWAQFGPRLKVEGKGRRWQRLPSPLGSAGEAEDEFEGEEEGSVELGLDGVGEISSGGERGSEGGISLEVSPVIGVMDTSEPSSSGNSSS